MYFAAASFNDSQITEIMLIHYLSLLYPRSL